MATCSSRPIQIQAAVLLWSRRFCVKVRYARWMGRGNLLWPLAASWNITQPTASMPVDIRRLSPMYIHLHISIHTRGIETKAIFHVHEVPAKEKTHATVHTCTSSVYQAYIYYCVVLQTKRSGITYYHSSSGGDPSFSSSSCFPFTDHRQW